jgi:hypothetical protein
MGTCNSKKCEFTNLKNETPQPPPPEYDECENNTNLNKLNELINQVKHIENKLPYFVNSHEWLTANRNLYAYLILQSSDTEKMIPNRNFLHSHEIENCCGNIMQTAYVLKNEKYIKQPWTLVNGLYTLI